MKKPKILFLGGGPAFPDSLPFKEKFEAFSKVCSGHILTPISGGRPFKKRWVGDFELHSFPYISKNSLSRNAYMFYKLISEGKKIYRKSSFQLVISPNPLTTGLAGLVLARTTEAKLLVEVNGNFESAFKFGRLGSPQARVIDHAKEKVARMLIEFVLSRADIVKLVHSRQLVPFRIKKKIKTTVFPNFVPISQFINHPKSDKKYILLLGFPWYLKGVDILIKAFKKISNEFPAYKLKIVGWCPEGREYYENLASGNTRIELCDAVEYDEVLKLMTDCSLYVLASRTDSSPRVLREAMASKKPIIASDIDGVPELIRHGYNGVLFKSGDVDDLAAKIGLLLRRKEMADQLADNGFNYVQNVLSENAYITKYKAIIEKVLGFYE